MLGWKLKKVKIKELKLQEKNPRRISKHDADKLEESIETYGMCEPLVVNSDMTIIGGHQRYRTAKKLGYKEIDVYVPTIPLDDKQVDELTIRLNRNHGEWDFDMLANNFEVDDLLDWGMTEEDLDIEQENICDEQKPKPSKIIIDFVERDHLEDAEAKISEIITAYQGATYRIKK